MNDDEFDDTEPEPGPDGPPEHNCDENPWTGWGPCIGCGMPRVCCTHCVEDLTDHRDTCPL